MKKLFTAFCLSLLALSASATVHNVTVQDNSYSPAQLTINLGDTVRFQWVAGSSSHPTQSDNGGFQPFNMDDNNPTHLLILQAVGTYPYHCIPHQGMGMVGTITVNSPTAAPEAIKKAEVAVFPNPANQQITVTHNFQQIDGVRVTNMIGQQVRFVKPQFGSNNRVVINIADLPKGMYLVNLQFKGNTVFTQRLVKDR